MTSGARRCVLTPHKPEPLSSQVTRDDISEVIELTNYNRFSRPIGDLFDPAKNNQHPPDFWIREPSRAFWGKAHNLFITRSAELRVIPEIDAAGFFGKRVLKRVLNTSPFLADNAFPSVVTVIRVLAWIPENEVKMTACYGV